MEITWTEQMSIGNAAIDAEHQNMIAMINELVRAIKSEDRYALSRELRRLREFMQHHFASEEKVIRATGIAFEHHNQTQQYLQDELRYLMEELEAKIGMMSGGAIEHFSRMLGGWMMNHLARDEAYLKPVLKTRAPDFVPG